MSSDSVQLFSSFASCVEASFWHKLCQIKLDVDKLEEKERSIWGYFSIVNCPGRLLVDVTAFNRDAERRSPQQLPMRGTLINKNTIESFRECDKVALLQQHGDRLRAEVEEGLDIEPSSFVLLTFADLKKYHFYYWFAFLAPKNLAVCSVLPATKVCDIFSQQQVQQLETQMMQTKFAVHLEEDNLQTMPFSAFGAMLQTAQSKDQIFLAFADPSSMQDTPGWPLRILLLLAASAWPQVCTTTTELQVLCVRGCSRPEGGTSAGNSLVLRLKVHPPPPDLQWVGWERNERGKLGPRLANLSTSMDSNRLAESAVDLNLRLMKWRLLPELDLDAVKNARCLLLGAGTLGCAVARGLLGWGVRNITLVDSGRVGFSNPVRQSLFKHEHCLAGGALKATAAAQTLTEIFPGVVAQDVVLSVPMPGHSVPDAQLAEVEAEVGKLESLVQSHDIVFLLTDTRESRWLPTLLAKKHNKIAINAALGFDSFLVMRHGMSTSPQDDTTTTPVESAGMQEIASAVPEHTASATPIHSGSISGSDLGCYFCNDVVAPRNSMASRTLDQQCTVVRPGVAQIAAALAVELMVSILQHPLRGLAAATTDPEKSDTGCSLGVLPHSIRGFLAQYQLMLPASQAFSRCAACSETVLGEYHSRGFHFLHQVFNTPGYLEDITGLAELQQQSLDCEVWALSDSDDTE